MLPHIVAFCGPIGVGKSTLAGAVRRWLQGRGVASVVRPFANEVKEDIVACFRHGDPNVKTALANHKLPQDAEQLVRDLTTKPYKPGVRELLNEWGAWRRRTDDEYWVKQWAYRILCDGVHVAICDDLRFGPELAFVKRANADIYLLRRDGVENVRALGEVSEKAVLTSGGEHLPMSDAGSPVFRLAVEVVGQKVLRRLKCSI
jgi:hypothetical protein